MARIKIEDLPKNMEITREEMKKLTGSGYFVQPQNISYKIRFMDPLDAKFTEPLD